jgi:hypothetical protein
MRENIKRIAFIFTGMILQQPFPSHNHFNKRSIRFTSLAGFVVFLVLAIFTPFGISHTFGYSLLYPLAYGFATFVMASLNLWLLPFVFGNLFREETWTVGKEILLMLWQILTISFANALLTHYLYGNPLSTGMLVYFAGITMAVGIFPVTLIVLLKQQLLLKKYREGAHELETSLQQTGSSATGLPAAEPPLIILSGDNQNEKLELSATDIYYINAADNYIKVYYREAEKTTHKVLRSSLKRAAGNLEAYPQLYRCHRAYIVNLAAVVHVSGNAQGYKLHLKDIEETIPVSRSLNHRIGTYLDNYSSISR